MGSPDDWRTVRVADLAATSANALATGPFGSAISSRFFRSSGVPVLRGSNLSTDPEVRLRDQGLAFLEPKKAAEFSRSIVRHGDLVFTCWGTINQVGIIDESAQYAEYVISNKQMKLTPDPRTVSSEFLYYLFSGPQMQQEILDGAIGSSVPGFNLTRLRSLELRLPPIQEQLRIAEAIGDVDHFARHLTRTIAKKRDVQQGVMQELLSGRARLHGFEQPWETISLGSVVSGLRGSGLSKSSISSDASTPCVLYGELFTTYGRVIQTVWSRTNDVAGVTSYGGEVLLPGSTTTTADDLAVASALLQPGVLIGGDINILRPNARRVDSSWLAYYLTSQKSRQIAEGAQGITIVHLYVRTLTALEIVLPLLEEQQAISAVLRDLEAEIAALESRLESARAIKQGMMQELLTGRTRLVAEGVAA